ncbi:hypothetical protein [Burkholderia cenocepacia]|uniref:hypothetical protein n=1 Tax=Burkholderia cenocepacia TaxID=95486 RepID=UPI002AB674FE|nr:hypothetical protein [Burkholderia cenocepacia]
MTSQFVAKEHLAKVTGNRVVTLEPRYPLEPPYSDDADSALPSFIGRPIDTPWWQEASVTAPMFLGAIVVVAVALCILIVSVSRANRRVSAMLRDTANTLATLAVAKADRVPVSDSAGVATAVSEQVAAAYYQELIAAVEHALSSHGYRFGHDALREVTLPIDVVLDVSKAFAKAQIKFLYPLISDTDLEKKVVVYREDGYSEKFVRSIVEAMRGQGRFVEMAPLAMERDGSFLEIV